MLTYSKEARDDYIETLTKAQHKLAELSSDILGYELTHWLIHKALSDLKTVVKKEWED